MKIQINKNELLRLLSQYYSDMLGKDITVLDEVSVKYIQGLKNINLRLFYEEIIGDGKKITFIYANDICNCLEAYADKNNLTFICFKYIGNIRNVGYYIDEDTAIFEGIEATFEEKCKKRIK